MRKLILLPVLLTLSFISINAQTINLPIYTEGQYQNDTIFSYYGALPFTGIGSIRFEEGLTFNFISGVKFKMVVDIITHTAFKDSLSILVPMHEGDTLDIPASFQLFSGNIGFHVIIEGTPLVAGESYFCDLGYVFTPGSDWGMMISRNSQQVCNVQDAAGINEKLNNSVHIYPNPVKENISIKADDLTKYKMVKLVDQLGRILSISKIDSSFISIDVHQITSGNYTLIFESENYRTIQKIQIN